MLWVYIWLGVVALSLIIEFFTFDLVSLWFFPSGLVSMVLAILKVDLIWQLIAFIAISAILLATCRAPIVKMLSKNKTKTNADAIIGKELTLLSSISFGNTGTVKVNGVIWTAACEQENSTINEGTIVKVVDIQGNKLIVKEI